MDPFSLSKTAQKAVKKESILIACTSAPASAAVSTTLRSSAAGMGPVDRAATFGYLVSERRAFVWRFLLKDEIFGIGVGKNDVGTAGSLSLRAMEAVERRD